MPQTITPTAFRVNLYQNLDKVIRTKKPLQIKRKDAIIQISVLPKKRKLSNLKTHRITDGNIGDLTSYSPSKWHEAKNL